MSAVFRLRPALPEDAEALSQLHNLSFDEGWNAKTISGWITHQAAFSALAEYSETGSSLPQFAGFALCLAAGDDAELLTIAVHPEARAQGAGAALMAFIDAEADARGLDRWLLEVAEDNAPAIALYRKFGLTPIGKRTGYYRRANAAVDAIVMAAACGFA